jgi:hypothetical protein
MAEQAARGNTLVLSGIQLAYLPTERDLGVTVEIFSGMPDADQEPDTS